MSEVVAPTGLSFVAAEVIDDRVHATRRFAAAAARAHEATWWCPVLDRRSAAEVVAAGGKVWQRPRRGRRGVADQVRENGDALARGEQWCWTETDLSGPVHTLLLVLTGADPLSVWRPHRVTESVVHIRTAVRAVLSIREDLAAAWVSEGAAAAVVEIDLVPVRGGHLVDGVRTLPTSDPELVHEITALLASRPAPFEAVTFDVDARAMALPRPGESPLGPALLGVGPLLTHATIGDSVIVHDGERTSVVDDSDGIWPRLVDGVWTTSLPRSAFAAVGRWIDNGWVEQDPPTGRAAAEPPPQRARPPVVRWNPVVCYRFADVAVSVRYPSHAVARLVAPVLRPMSAPATDVVDVALHVEADGEGSWGIAGSGIAADPVTWQQLPAAVRDAVIRAGHVHRTLAALPAAVVTDERAAVAVVGTRFARAQLLDAWTARGGLVVGDEALVEHDADPVLASGLRIGLELRNADGCVESRTPWGVARPLVDTSGRFVNHWQVPRDRARGGPVPLIAVALVELAVEPAAAAIRPSPADVARAFTDTPGWHSRSQDVGFAAAVIRDVPCERWVVSSGADVVDRVADLLGRGVRP